MPPKMMAWDEARLKSIDKSLRSVAHVRDVIWNGTQIGIWDDDFLEFLRSPAEFVPAGVLAFKDVKERYEALAQNKLMRPGLKVLREYEVGAAAVTAAAKNAVGL